MGKKKFISKGEGQHFYLLHRSQRDEAYAKEERPSDFVLVPASEASNQSVPERPSFQNHQQKALKNHVTSLGFANDGYDYTQHLKIMGGGKFIGKDGKVRESETVALYEVELPSDVIPSDGVELERQLQAITISSDCMDEDIKAALFDDATEFEELDDDFVAQVTTEPEAPDFDFDAHIARLIAQSESQTVRVGDVATGPRGWGTDTSSSALKESGKVGGGGRFLRNKHVQGADGRDELYEYAEGYEGHGEDEEGEWLDDDDEEYDTDEDDRGGGRVSSGVEVDAIFEKVLEDYGDDDIGDLEEADASEVEGAIDFDDDNELLTQALDEYLQEQKDEKLMQGLSASYRNGGKGQQKSSFADLKGECESGIDDTFGTFKSAYEEQMRLQREAQEELESCLPSLKTSTGAGGKKGAGDALDLSAKKLSGVLEAMRVQDNDELFTSQEYLREVIVQEEWDCESVLSTYSTLDNHPALIKDPNSKFRAHKTRGERRAEAEAAVILSRGSSVGPLGHGSSVAGGIGLYRAGFSSAGDDATSVASYTSRRSAASVGRGFSGLASRISGAAASAGAEVASITAAPQKLAAPPSRPIAALSRSIQGDRSARLVATQETSHEEEDGDDDDEEHSSDGGSSPPAGSRKGETAEQKKHRKARVKEERRQKRAAKKVMKNAFRGEEERSGLRGKQAEVGKLDRVSVFKYSV